MEKEIYQALLNTLQSPVVFVDNDHIIRYLNRAAQVRYYEHQGFSNLIGKSLFDCHNKNSEQRMIQIHARLVAGEDRVLLKSSDTETISVVAVRDHDRRLLGYYEYFEWRTDA
ncbi:PAS domain-containing protein [uncultured Desulfuromonas sp.]|uniref:PAS domain-containing protein n=1 Tax=uncultured Desulfuromonas sp. TaxID=181013 RepID=UPI002AAC237B|nr:PAS domain-containing protein [uncultured Desulfuromonas sp.]